MAIFGAMDTSGSGMRVMRTWLDAVADNLANLRTVAKPGEEPFHARVVIAEAVQDGRLGGTGTATGTGARVAEIRAANDQGRPEWDPQHPYADANGLVYYPGTDMGTEMTHLMAAQRGYQANLAALDKAKEAYQAALRLGR
jgi:flagellar basal-body rod protein FlgC